MKKLIQISLYISLFFLSIILVNCDKSDPVIPNEEELITTLIYTLTPPGGGAAEVLTFRDLDGDGGNPPTITGGTLNSGIEYIGTLTLLNEAEPPVEDITEEIAEENTSHQFFFNVTNGLELEVAYGDTDDLGNPLGLSTITSAGKVSSGNLVITLRHEPDKFAEGVFDGDITNAGGNTDIQVTFPVEIQ